MFNTVRDSLTPDAGQIGATLDIREAIPAMIMVR